MKHLIAASLAAIAGLTAAPALADPPPMHLGAGAGVAADAADPALPLLHAPSTFPARIGAADTGLSERIAAMPLAGRGGTMTADVRVCVAPTGAVTGVELWSTSGVGAFDAVVLDTARAWTYQGYGAPPSTRVCMVVSVVYRALLPAMASSRRARASRALPATPQSLAIPPDVPAAR
jgi:outer membrane biosynthesis protein TonB